MADEFNREADPESVSQVTRLLRQVRAGDGAAGAALLIHDPVAAA